MTLDEMQKKRIAMAKLCKWKDIVITSLDSEDGIEPNSPTALRFHQQIPRFHLLLDEIHEAEKHLTIPQSIEYEQELDRLVNADFLSGESCMVIPIWHATAMQKFEAFPIPQ